MFRGLIEELYEKYGKTVVVLIDEYDKPILDHITDIETAEANRAVLKGFYGILKSVDPYLRMTFITGVTKFTKTSIFSELNNLYDITMDPEYADICGITPDDLGHYFSEHIDGLMSLEQYKQNLSVQDQILNWYDGYSWDGETRVINPFSLLSFLKRKTFNCFWFSSGTPKFLMSLIKNRPMGYIGLDDIKMSELAMDAFDIDCIEVEALLFQTGYLTVKRLLPTTGSPIYQ